MTQFQFDDLVPAVDTGVTLSTSINSWKDALQTMHKGSSQPSYVDNGMIWIDDAADPIWTLNLYDGTDDISLGTIDSTNNVFLANGLLGVTESVSANHTFVVSEKNKALAVSASGAARTVNLLASATAGSGFANAIKKTDSSVNGVVLTPDGSDTIEGAADFTLQSENESVIIVLIGTDWKIISRYRGVVTGESSPNILLNGEFKIWQRGTALAASSAQYSSDRWESRYGANPHTISRQAGDLSQYSARVQRDPAETALDVINFAQSMETGDSVILADQTVTLTFRAKKLANFSAASDILSSNIPTGTGTDESVISGYTGQSNNSQNNTLTTSWQTFTHTATLAANTNELAVVFAYTPVGTAGALDAYEIELVKLEIGSVATEFESVSFGEELDRCRRFTWVIGGSGFSGNFSGFNISTTQARIGITFDQPLRVAPTFSIADQTVWNLYDNTAGILATTAVANVVADETSAQITATVAAGLVVGEGTLFFSDNSVELLIYDAEL